MNVIELIQARKSYRAQNITHGDGFKLGLSVEGGGMRGIVTAAMLSALQDLNILDLFDSFYASSSGCANLAYVLAGQAWEGTSIYYDKLATRHFIDPSRALYHRNIMDMNYVQQLWNEEVPLDIPAVLNSKKDIVFALSNVSELTGILKRDFLDEADFFSSLTASVQIPILGGQPIEIGGDKYLDGGLFFADPFYAAVDDGCTHVLALHSRPVNGYPVKLRSGSSIMAQRINSIADGAGDLYVKRLAQYYYDSSQIGFGNIHLNGVQLYRHAVIADGHEVKRMTTDFAKLIRGGRSGYNSISQLFNPGSKTVISFTNSVKKTNNLHA